VRIAVLLSCAMFLIAFAPPPDRPTGSNIPGGQTSSPVQKVGNVGPEDYDPSSLPKTRQVARKFAQCVVAKHPAQASAVILQDLRNKEIIQKYSILRDSQCAVNAEKEAFGIRLDFPGDTFRYVVAEALVNAQVAVPLGDVAMIAPLQHRVIDPRVIAAGSKLSGKAAQAFEEAKRFEEGQILALQLGECIVRADPMGSHKLLFTQPASLDEDAAIGALQPKMGRCVPVGQKLAVNVVMIRGAIAVTYYRLAKAPLVALRQLEHP
jgi:hypothetical protein